MEISLIGSSQLNLARNADVGLCSFSKNLNAKFFSLKNYNPKGCRLSQIQSLGWSSKSGVGFTVRACNAARAGAAVISEKASEDTRNESIDSVKLYVGLPLDTVSDCNTIRHARAIATGLKALKLLGVEGVELPIWWGVAENEGRGKYQWEGYLSIAEMVQELGLKLHVSLCFHASEECKIPLPQWVSLIGEKESSIYFMDRSGESYKGCLSFGVDDVPVLDGKTPIEVYEEFCESFKGAFSPFLGSTVTGVSIGLGPDGELRYPSHHQPAKSNTEHNGAGEFQCYDKNMLNNLNQHATTHGNPMWGLGGPHDAPGYNQCPISNGTFFSENGGSWDTQYGEFFLSWYSNQLISHGDRILSLASSTFKDRCVSVSGKIPILPSWYGTRSHPAELTAGFYNTAHRDGYDKVAEVFSRYSCKMILPGMDLSDKGHPRSSPDLLLAQIATSCRKHAVEVCGQNSLVSGDSRGFELIKRHLLDGNAGVESFTYQRMGAYFFSPEHFPLFARFVRGLNEPSQDPEDVAVSHTETSLHVQTV